MMNKSNRSQLEKKILGKEKELFKSLDTLNRELRSDGFVQNLRSWKNFRPDPLQVDLNVFPGLHDYFQRVEQGPISCEESMNYEWIRLSSLSSYRGAGSAIQLAKHGFYHDSEHGPLATRCYACQLLYTNWEYFDNIEDKHRRLSPNCPLVHNNEPTPQHLSNDNSSDRHQATVEAPQVTTAPQTTESVTNITDSMERTNIRDMVPDGFPTQPTEDGFNSENNRLSPGTTAQAAVFGQPKTESLGRSDKCTNNTATTNNNGVADFTRCFVCGGGLRNWEAGDDPCLEHTRWYPRCEYMNKLKGTRYVQAVKRLQVQHVAEQHRRQNQQQEQRRQAASSNTPQDPLTTPAGLVLLEMGYTRSRVSEAILGVRRNTGNNSVNAEQAMMWILNKDEQAASTASGETFPTPVLPGQSTLRTMPSSTPTSAIGNRRIIIDPVTLPLGIELQSISARPIPPRQQRALYTGVESAPPRQQRALSTGVESAPPRPLPEQAGADSGSLPASTLLLQTREIEIEAGAEGGEQPAGKQNKRNGKKSRKGKGASENKGGASNQVEAEGPSEPKEIDTKHLKEENKKLREMQTCKICMDKPMNMTLLPCGHLVCCEACAPHLRKCPICRKRIESSVRTFMS